MSKIVTMKALATVIQILTLVFYLFLFIYSFSSGQFCLLLSGKWFVQSQNKNIRVGSDSSITSADTAAV